MMSEKHDDELIVTYKELAKLLGVKKVIYVHSVEKSLGLHGIRIEVIR